METVTGVYGMVSDLIDRWNRHQDMRANIKAPIRLLYIESRRNLAVLEAALGGDDGTRLEDSALYAIPGQLETSVLEQVFMGQHHQKKALKELNDLSISGDHRESTSDRFLMNLYVRITALQKLAAAR